MLEWPRATEPSGPPLRERCAVGAALLALFAMELSLTNSWGLLTQTPWLDECLTLLVVNDVSFSHGLAAIAGGVENTPPGFFALLWPIGRLIGGFAPVGLRALNCLFVVAGCVAVYASCRLMVDRQRAAVGTLAVAIHPAIVVQLFQVRFYAFWFAVTAWFVYAAIRSRGEPQTLGQVIAPCALAVLMVSTHWFGVIGLGLITTGELLASENARRRIAAWLPMAAGLVTLLLCYPILSAQRSSLTVPTWIDPLTSAGLWHEAGAIYGVAPVALIAACGVWRVAARPGRDGERAAWRSAMPGLSLLWLPVVLLGVSLAVQPVLRSRYAIPTAIAVGILAALVSPPASARRGRMLGSAACLAMMAIGVIEVSQLRRESAPGVTALDRSIALADSIAGVAESRPIVFLRRFEREPALQRRPWLASATALIDFEGGRDAFPVFWLFERDMARRVNRAYPDHRLARVADLEECREFIVVARAADAPMLARLFPRHRIREQAAGVYVVDRS